MPTTGFDSSRSSRLPQRSGPANVLATRAAYVSRQAASVSSPRKYALASGEHSSADRSAIAMPSPQNGGMTATASPTSGYSRQARGAGRTVTGYVAACVPGIAVLQSSRSRSAGTVRTASSNAASRAAVPPPSLRNAAPPNKAATFSRPSSTGAMPT